MLQEWHNKSKTYALLSTRNNDAFLIMIIAFAFFFACFMYNYQMGLNLTQCYYFMQQSVTIFLYSLGNLQMTSFSA